MGERPYSCEKKTVFSKRDNFMILEKITVGAVIRGGIVVCLTYSPSFLYSDVLLEQSSNWGIRKMWQ